MKPITLDTAASRLGTFGTAWQRPDSIDHLAECRAPGLEEAGRSGQPVWSGGPYRAEKIRQLGKQCHDLGRERVCGCASEQHQRGLGQERGLCALHRRGAGDNPLAAAVAYTAGGKIAAVVGRNRNIQLDGNTSNKANSGRTAFLDLAGGFGCANSVKVDFDGIPGCDPCVNTTPLLPDSRFGVLDTDDFSGFPDNFFLLIAGEDYDDLQIGWTVDTFARLEFEIAGHVWAMWWGPYWTGGGTANPESPAIKVMRVSATEWRFQTAGDHRAALYRRNSNYSHEYHGQFTVKFSGTAMALPNQALPPGNHCDIKAHAGDPACTPTP